MCYGIGTLRKHIFVVKNSLLQHDRRRLRIENTTAWETQNLHRIWSDLWVLSVNAEQGRQALSAYRLLEISNFSLATDPKDKVYGLLGMMTPSIAQRITPDYNLDYGPIFAATAKAHILESKNLDKSMGFDQHSDKGARLDVCERTSHSKRIMQAVTSPQDSNF